MAVTAQTLSRDVDRVFAYTRDFVLAQIDEAAFNHSPAVAIFFGELLLRMAGPQQMNSRAKDTQTGGNTVIGRVNLGAHAGAKRMAGAFDTHNVASLAIESSDSIIARSTGIPSGPTVASTLISATMPISEAISG